MSRAVYWKGRLTRSLFGEIGSDSDVWEVPWPRFGGRKFVGVDE